MPVNIALSRLRRLTSGNSIFEYVATSGGPKMLSKFMLFRRYEASSTDDTSVE